MYRHFIRDNYDDCDNYYDYDDDDICFETDCCYYGDTNNLKIFENNDKTIAVETGHKLDGINLVLKRYPWVNPVWILRMKEFYMNDKMVAIVKLADGDICDESIGHEMALAKLNRMCVVQRENVVKRFEEYIKQRLDNPATKKDMSKFK